MMLRIEIAMMLFMVMAAGSAGGIWYAHHRGYEAGKSAQQSADRAARRRDHKQQKKMAVDLANLRAASRAAAAKAERELGMAHGACLDRPLPVSAVRSLQHAGVRTPASGSRSHQAAPSAGPAG